ncbi:toll-like receptor 19 [Triplophysa dalaica]|uniref:toll-like receptor 19 n=1 Tax=Triplophysa dalaica TaxID=1582913 RepID=UPI0024E03ECB|nr:toll-like receptor 19 [Triplophysa dalaica]
MDLYASPSNRVSLRIWWISALCLSICNVSFALITRRCITIEEHLLKDMPKTPYCYRLPGMGLYAECNVTDLRTDLTEVSPEVRSLCIITDIKSIPANAFSNFPNLEVLEIKGESLVRIEAGAFSGLRSLKELWMLFNNAECSSVNVESLAFSGLSNLEKLTLIGLRLANVSSIIFDPLIKLIRLQLIRTFEQNLGDIFCHLSEGMASLKELNVLDSFISTIENNGCSDGSKSWPLNVLAGIQNLDLTGNLFEVIKTHTLSAFQNLSSLMIEFKGESLDSIWESGLGNVSDLTLKGDVMSKGNTNVSDLCHLISRLHPRSLSLIYEKIDRWTAEDLKDCKTELINLSIGCSEVTHLDFDFWTCKPEIQTFKFYSMKLTEAPFCVAANGTVWSVTALDLSENLLREVEGDQFACMPHLEKLVLSNNAIQRLMTHAFRGLKNLTFLNLNSNKISKLTANDFRYLYSLEVVLINDNIIESIEEGTFRHQHELRELAIGRLEYVYELYISKIFHGFPPKMQRLSIDAHFGTNFYLGKAPQPSGTFVLELKGDRLGFIGCDAPVLKAVREVKVTCAYFICKNDFMAPFFPNLESFEITETSERVLISYTDINTLHRLKRLKLVNLRFNNNTDVRRVFWNLTQLQVLVLVNCHISFLTRSMFQNLTSLQLLRLYSDSPLVLVDGTFDVLPALKVFFLDRVDFQCNCINGWILEWAESTKSVQVVSIQKQECVWHYQKRNFLETMEKLCQTDTQYLCYVGTAACVSLVMSLAVGYRFARWPSVVLYFRLRGLAERMFGRQWQRRRRRLERVDGELEEVKYDAFVSFCNRDEAWVMEEMIPRLEEQGHLRLRLCLHNRDFEVGKGIVDNIKESINSSQCTICLISRSYLRSNWCGLEIRVATHHQLEEEDYRLILIFLEHISPFELSAFHRLARLVRSQTYLDWPEDEADRVNFWDRLRKNIVEVDTNAS